MGEAGDSRPPAPTVSRRAEFRLEGGAWIHPESTIGEDVVIEPEAVIGKDVTIGPGCWIGAGVVLYGPTSLGAKNQLYPGVILGGPPQDMDYRGEPTRLEIGERNIFREGFTANRASTKEEGVTRIGNDNFFMSGSHVGHDAVIEDHVVVANGTFVAGHCHIESWANLAGGVAVAQFCRVGRYAFVGGLGGVRKDAEPYICHDHGSRAPEVSPICINVVGLKRGGMAPEIIRQLRTAYKVIYMRKDQARDLEEVRAEIDERGALCSEVDYLLEFIRLRDASGRGRRK